jgi:predicted AlkP superfamily phosphohydrolase/phosphomutase
MDAMVGRIIKRIGEEMPLLVLSDHGFTSLDTYVHLNSWLTQNGFMVLKNGKRQGGPLFEDVDWSKTRAYALGFNSIYINIKGREGKGIVEQDEAGALCHDLIQKLTEWTEDGKSIVKKVYKSREIYSGNRIDNGPDLVIGYQNGYRASKQTVLGEAPGGRLIEDNLSHWCGDHCCDPSHVPGVLFGTNLDKADINLPEAVSGEDISSIIEKWIHTVHER